MKWEKELFVARQASQEAGRILTSRFGQINRVMKKGAIDLVTEADLQSEKAILDIIGRHFPQDTIIAEEGGESGQLTERVWLIDPLDGTTNFTHNFPFFAVSIALEVEKELVLGAVFNPSADEYFEAVKGMGSTLNNNPIKVAQTGEYNQEIIDKLTQPMHLSRRWLFFYRLMGKIGIANFYWDNQLKQNKAFDQRFARPYAD